MQIIKHGITNCKDAVQNLQKFRADGTTPIAGVEFEIKFLEAAIQPTSKKHPNFRRLLNVGETTVRHTDSEGKVFFDNLDQGTYQITEIKTEPENALLKEPIILDATIHNDSEMKPYNMAMLIFLLQKKIQDIQINGIFIAVNMTLPIMQSSKCQ